jgi:hypothetical protein
VNRAQRRIAKAKDRKVGHLVARRDGIVSRLGQIQQEIAGLDLHQEAAREDLVDKLATMVSMTRETETSDLQALVDDALDNVGNAVFESFVRAKWRGATRENIREKLASEAVRRAMLRGDIFVALAALDRIAFEAHEAKLRNEDFVEAAHRVYGGTLGSERALEVRQRLVEAEWRNCSIGTFEDMVVSSIVSDLDTNALVARNFSVLSQHVTDASEVAFNRRVDGEHDQVRRRNAVTTLLRNVFERHRERFAKVFDDVPIDMDLDDAARLIVHRIGGDLHEHEIRSLVIGTGWRGVTEETFNFEIARYCIQAFRGSGLNETQSEIPSDVQAIVDRMQVVGSSIKVTAKPSGRASLSQATFEYTLMRIGVKLWEQTYAKGMTDLQVAEVVAKDDRLDAPTGHFAALWAVHAFQRMTTSHTFASALMCTDVDAVSLADVEDQWRAWMIMVPNGMLPVPEMQKLGQVEFTRIAVAVYDAGAWMQLCAFPDAGTRIEAVVSTAFGGTSLADMLTQQSEPIDTPGGRIEVVAKRLVAGLLLSLQNREAVRSRDVQARHGRPGRDEGEPAHRVVMVGHPLKIDCREAVSNYIATGHAKRGGSGSLPQVQWIVRGHYRQQVYGPRRLGRKTIWIKPHWKGRADAPILSRAKHLE